MKCNYVVMFHSSRDAYLNDTENDFEVYDDIKEIEKLKGNFFVFKRV